MYIKTIDISLTLTWYFKPHVKGVEVIPRTDSHSDDIISPSGDKIEPLFLEGI